MGEVWWKEAIVYQVYPASFCDANGDGWGDVRGITSKIDYLKQLGVDIIWVSPIYKSPQIDMGYDVADYKQIDPRYGSIEDVDELIAELKKRDMRLMMDLVVNHTSDQHAWFLESRSSLTNPYRDFYIWKKPRYDNDGNPAPPNNWTQLFARKSAWTYDPHTNEYYLSLFTNEQVDLNWENPKVRAAVHDIMHFWIKRGVCGFRMDVINLISKDQRFPDAEPVFGPDAEFHPGGKFYIDGPRLHEFLQEIKCEVLDKTGAITVGEMPGDKDVEEALRSVHSKTGTLNMIFIFDIADIDNAPGKARLSLQTWTPRTLAGIVTKWQKAMLEYDGWNSVFLENHDQPRSVSRYTDDSFKHRYHGAKLLALMQTTLNGTLYIYQGQELGMKNMPEDWEIDGNYKDIESLNFWKLVNALHGDDPSLVAEGKHILAKKARDHSRTPMQWDSSSNAGFSPATVKPWMPVNDDYMTINAKAQANYESESDLSIYQFWQRGLRHRKEHRDAFVYGDFETIDHAVDNVFAYVRTSKKGGKWLVVLNFSGDSTKWDVPEKVNVAKWVAGNYGKGEIEKQLAGQIDLSPWEGLLGVCKV